MTTYIRYVLGWAASEEFWEGVKHDLVYELLGRVLQLSFGPFVVFQVPLFKVRERKSSLSKGFVFVKGMRLLYGRLPQQEHISQELRSNAREVTSKLSTIPERQTAHSHNYQNIQNHHHHRHDNNNNNNNSKKKTDCVVCWQFFSDVHQSVSVFVSLEVRDLDIEDIITL